MAKRKRKNPDGDRRSYERAYSTGDQSAGLQLVSDLIKSGDLELSRFPLSLLTASQDLRHLLQQRYNRQDALIQVRGISFVHIINLINEITDEFIEAQVENTDPEEHRLEQFFNKYLPGTDNHNRARELRLIEDGEKEKDHAIQINYCADTIIVLMASQYGADYPEVTIDNYRNLPDPMGLLRKFTFHFASDTIRLANIEIVVHESGLWQSRNSERHLTAHTGNCLILSSDISLPFDGSPRLITGSCEDKPCCGHDICPPRWSHTGAIAASVCAFCGGMVGRGSRYSSHDNCIRRSLREEDPDFEYGVRDDEDPDEESEEDHDADDEDADNDDYFDDQHEYEYDPPDYND